MTSSATDSFAATSDLPLVHVIDDLERLKVLADPLRLRILEELCHQARTTKQVAEVLGEPPTRLYHHVDTLERAGLIRLERTRPVRGTLEKYYRSVARAFRADPGLLALDGGAAQTAVAAELLEAAAAELRALPGSLAPVDNVDVAGHAAALAERLLVANLSLRRLGAAHIAELRRRLEALLEEMQSWADEAPDAPRRAEPEHRLVVALYPLGAPSVEAKLENGDLEDAGDIEDESIENEDSDNTEENHR